MKNIKATNNTKKTSVAKPASTLQVETVKDGNLKVLKINGVAVLASTTDDLEY